MPDEGGTDNPSTSCRGSPRAEVRPRSSSATAVQTSGSKWPREEDTRSQQITTRSQSRGASILKRAFSIQFGRSKESDKLDRETVARIKVRYKDVAKYVVWPECPFPAEYNSAFVTLNGDNSKRSAVRYTHAGNHQSTAMGVGDRWGDTRRTNALLTGRLDRASAHTNNITVSQSTSFPHSPSPSRVRQLASLPEEQRAEGTHTEGAVADIEDDRTPVPPPTINSVRRSESSDEEESIIAVTAHSDDVFPGDEHNPEIRILRL